MDLKFLETLENSTRSTLHMFNFYFLRFCLKIQILKCVKTQENQPEAHPYGFLNSRTCTVRTFFLLRKFEINEKQFKFFLSWVCFGLFSDTSVFLFIIIAIFNTLLNVIDRHFNVTRHFVVYSTKSVNKTWLAGMERRKRGACFPFY